MKHITEYQINLIICIVYFILTILSLCWHYETDVFICWMGFCTFRIIAELNKSS